MMLLLYSGSVSSRHLRANMPATRSSAPTRRSSRTQRPNNNSLESFEGRIRQLTPRRANRRVQVAVTPSSSQATARLQRHAPLRVGGASGRGRGLSDSLIARIADAETHIAQLRRAAGQEMLSREDGGIEEIDLTDQQEVEAAFVNALNSPPVVAPRRGPMDNPFVQQLRPDNLVDAVGSPLEASQEENVRVDREHEIEYVTNVHVHVWVNKARVCTETGRGDIKRSQLITDGLGWVEDLVHARIQAKIGDEDFRWEKQLVVVKSGSIRVNNVSQDVDGFGVEMLETILKIADSQYQKAPRYNVVIAFEIRVRCDALTEFGAPKQRRVTAPSESPLPMRTPDGERNDRSSQLRRLNAASERVHAYQLRGEFITDLHNHWRCFDPSCPNEKNYCYYNSSERPGLHFKLDGSDVDSWASAMERSEAGVDRQVPPPLLKARIYNKGAVQRGNLTSAKPTMAQRLTQQAEQMAELQAQYEMLQREERTRRLEDKIEASLRRKEEMDAARELKEQEAHDAEIQCLRAAGSRQGGAISRSSFMSPPPGYRPTPPVPQPLTLQPSSPIDAGQDDYDLVTAFFEWLISRQKTVGRRAEFEHAKEVAETKYWSLDDLKQMADPETPLYRMATSADCRIPDGIARSFARNLKQYKALYRRQKEDAAAGALLGLGADGIDHQDPRFR